MIYWKSNYIKTLEINYKKCKGKLKFTETICTAQYELQNLQVTVTIYELYYCTLNKIDCVSVASYCCQWEIN